MLPQVYNGLKYSLANYNQEIVNTILKKGGGWSLWAGGNLNVGPIWCTSRTLDMPDFFLFFVFSPTSDTIKKKRIKIHLFSKQKLWSIILLIFSF